MARPRFDSSEPGGGRSTGRAIAVLVAVLVTAASLAACTSSDRAARNRELAARERQDRALAAQDQIVQLANRLGAARANVVAARRTLRNLRAELATTEAMLNGIANDRQTLGYYGTSLEDLCARNRGKANKQALRYLNLSCPAPGRWKVDHPSNSLPSNDLAVERRAARLLNKIEAAKARVVQAKQNLAHVRQVVKVARVALNKKPGARQIVRSFGFTFDNLCTPIVANGDRAQRVREDRRQQALRSLNVTCPAP